MLAWSVLFLMAGVILAGEGEWSEIISPPELDERDGRAILNIVPFDGRLYLRYSTSKWKAGIYSFEPEGEDFVRGEARLEYRTDSRALGQFRVIQEKLYVPDAGPPEGAAGGFYVSAGKRKWERVPVGSLKAKYYDIVRFDGKMFLSGSAQNGAIASIGSEENWETIYLTKEAARWSPRASRLLVVGEELFVLASREVDTKSAVSYLFAPQAWGAWYVLRYFSDGSVRGFLFDGPSRPLLALRYMAPGSRLARAGYFISEGRAFGTGTLYVVLSGDGTSHDPEGGLFYAKVREVPAADGSIPFAERIPSMELARDISLEGETCYVLLSENASNKANVLCSRDLKEWKTLFDGTLPAQAVCLGVLDGICYVGLVNGALGTVGQ